ncbi:hypothetical protein ACTQ5K_00515 [Niallia sp. Sow4_A1]|uniref:hypothetical protein n=1 Tax=unclassified Niallia TaxID=2837522 RepID=UPI00203C49A2|nr:hypothetical protein [Niallia sp. MER TA 168]MCM3360966.1 hypothetical protein [Niallia sp. MER TA 168]
MVKLLNENEATLLIHSYGIKCDVQMVKQWLKEGKLKGVEKEGNTIIEEGAVYNFLAAYRWEGTAYEQGIDDQLKISRLLEEVEDYRQRVIELEKEKSQLKEQLQNLLGIMPF